MTKINNNGCELAFAITAIANAIINEVDNDCAALLAVIFTQLGDTLATLTVISGMNTCCEKNENDKSGLYR